MAAAPASVGAVGSAVAGCVTMLAAETSDSIAWVTVVVSLAAGAIGSVVTSLLVFGGRIARIGREIDANDRAIGNIDEHLERWVADATINLVRELGQIRAELAARGMFYSGEYQHRVSLAKERALHAYRDQENTARSQAAEIRAREGSLHGLVRAWRLAGDPSSAPRNAYGQCWIGGRRRQRSTSARRTSPSRSRVTHERELSKARSTTSARDRTRSHEERRVHAVQTPVIPRHRVDAD
jgi:hypothetical protein